MAGRRVGDEPAFVLHRYDWSESSLVLEVFTRHLGRIALVAKGVKRPTSSFRPVLLPLQPLRIAFGGDAEVRTLKGAEWVGGYVMPVGEALLSGYYLNELLMQLLAREDAHPALFDGYAWVVNVLATGAPGLLQGALRTFEIVVLRETGFLPRLDVQTLTQTAVDLQQRYVLVPEAGLRLAGGGEPMGMDGSNWLALQAALDAPDCLPALLRVCVQIGSELKPQLRVLLQYHCGGAVLRTRQLMVDLQSL